MNSPAHEAAARQAAARQAVLLCRQLAQFSEESGKTTRTFLSPPMRDAHRLLTTLMAGAGMRVSVDAMGNLHGTTAARPDAPRLLIGSHLDTVPDAGAFDGILGVVLGTLLARTCEEVSNTLCLHLIGFSEEEGVRFGTPFLGSRALAGSIDEQTLDRRDRNGRSVREAIADFGLDPAAIPNSSLDARLRDTAIGYFEIHIEQGPVLENLNLPLGIVDAIAGQSRLEIVFDGKANHAGTTPMNLRRDALAGAAEWIMRVEQEGRGSGGGVATVGRIEVVPNASNAVAGQSRASLDARHVSDARRKDTVGRLVSAADEIARRRGLEIRYNYNLDQPAVPMDSKLTESLENAVQSAGFPVHRMVSGAGHDAMIMAPLVPAAMLFLRSPGGVSHSPEESVLEADVDAALAAGARFIRDLARQYA
jgi:allantoate deiminase